MAMFYNLEHTEIKPDLKITVKDELTYSEVVLEDVEAWWTVMRLKKEIESRTGIAAKRQRLRHEDQHMLNDDTLEELEIPEEATVHLIYRQKKSKPSKWRLI
ncbi:uncharacterized protein LOC143032450 [Oratosquilla oratoria]|uniref:uncharacterized protein LOC143032450 n=1 Tax=Oratosquilla oratoria TaxID=337810 RepID=UPI003F776080